MCDNMNIPWTIHLVERYKKKINFKSLSASTKLDWDIDFVRKYKNRLSWSVAYNQGLSSNPSIPWSKDFILEFESYLDVSFFISDYNMIAHKEIHPFILEVGVTDILKKLKTAANKT